MADGRPRLSGSMRRTITPRHIRSYGVTMLLGLLPLAWANGPAIATAETTVGKNAGAQATPSGTQDAGGAVKPESQQSSEAEAQALVRGHLPELVKLLDTLRRESPEQYRRAVADLARHARRLENARRRDGRLFEIELEILKRQTRVDLLVARLQLRDDAQTHAQLRRSLAGLQQARLARLTYDRDQAEQRLARAEQQLQVAEDRLQSARETAPVWVRQTYLHLLRKVGRDAEKAGAEADPAEVEQSSQQPKPNKPKKDKSNQSSSDSSGSQQREPQNSGSPR